jgi:[methyl-Co(III) methanol-specific corrinoid protein]:coenzyme M methyltransferase
MSMTPKDRVIAAMNKENLDRPAVAIFTQSATIGQMDKVGAAWPEAHKDAALMAKLAAAQADVFGYEAVRASFCLTAEAERLGCKVAVDKRDAAPMIKTHPFKFDPMTGEYDDPFSIMSVDEFAKEGRVKVVQDAVSMLKKSHGDKYAVIAGNTGPFTLAGHMVSTENLIFGMMMAPEEVDKWVLAVTPIVKTYTQALLDAGADVVQCSEPSASTDMLAPDMFEEAAGASIKNSLAKVSGMTSLHICGDTYPILDQMAELGVTALSVEEKVDPFKAIEKVAGKVAMVGNVGSVRPLYQGTPAEVKEAAIRSAQAGFNVISAGCGVAPASADENMQAMVDAIMGYKK